MHLAWFSLEGTKKLSTKPGSNGLVSVPHELSKKRTGVLFLFFFNLRESDYIQIFLKLNTWANHGHI